MLGKNGETVQGKDHADEVEAVLKTPPKKGLVKAAQRWSGGDDAITSRSSTTVKRKRVNGTTKNSAAASDRASALKQAGKIPRARHPQHKPIADVGLANRKSERVRVPSDKLKPRDEVHVKEIKLEEEGFEEDILDEAKSHCPTADEYSNPIYIYACLKNPEGVAGHISTWEDHKDIDGVINNDNEPFYDWEAIPRDAIYIVLAEHMICKPFGTALFFATRTKDSKYVLKVGFYYSYEKASDPCLYSLKEWCDDETMCGWPILQCEEAIRANLNWPRFKELYESMEKAVNQEMDSRKKGPGIRNHYGKNRVRPFRKRAPVLGQ